MKFIYVLDLWPYVWLYSRAVSNQERVIVARVLELVSEELNHFGVIADLFWQIGGRSTRFVLFCSF